MDKLFPYQIEGAKWLISKKQALLADKQRLGKTVQAISAFELVNASRVLVVCKAVAREQWAAEVARWSVRDRHIKIVTSPNRNENPPPNSVTICSYESTKGVQEGLKDNFDVIIIDEAHAIKNPTAKRTGRIIGRRGFLHRTEYFWMLTGTPTPNHAGELWTMLYTFGRTALTYEAFLRRYCDVIDGGFGMHVSGTKTTDLEAMNELKGLLEPVMLRRTELDVGIDLPKISFSDQIVKAGKVNAEEAFPEFYRPVNRVNELEELIKQEMGIVRGILEGVYASNELIEVLKASAKSISTLRRYTVMQKLDAAAALIDEELESNAYQKVVIFGIHTAAIDGIMKRLVHYNPVSVVGGTADAAANIKKFQDPNSDCRVFVGNIQAAGTSISLTAANHIYFLEEGWTPGDNAQAAMRCGGINQPNPIFVTTLLLENSVDIKVHELLKRKTEEQIEIYSKMNEIL